MHVVVIVNIVFAVFVLTFRSVGLGSYLRAHICHSYPGPLSCMLSCRLPSLSHNVVVVVRLCLRLVIYNKYHSTYLSHCSLCLESESYT